MSKNNVIDIESFIRKGKSKKQKTKNNDKISLIKETSIIQSSPQPITSLRQNTIKQERRQVRRSLFREFIQAQAVIPSKGMLEIYLQNISENGVAFDIVKDKGRFKNGELVRLRIYITYDVYFPFTVKVKHTRTKVTEGYEVYRHGASFIKNDINEKALVYFAKFIENATTVLKKDKGDVRVSGIVE